MGRSFSCITVGCGCFGRWRLQGRSHGWNGSRSGDESDLVMSEGSEEVNGKQFQEAQAFKEWGMGAAGGKILKPVMKIDPDSVCFGRAIGRGAFGKVYKGIHNDKCVAIKVFTGGSELGSRGQKLEAMLGQAVGHPNVIQTIGAYVGPVNNILFTDSTITLDGNATYCSSMMDTASSDFFSDMAQALQPLDGNIHKSTETWIVMEYCDRGSLHTAIRTGEFFKDETRTEPDMLRALKAALEIASGMAYLHSLNIVHGDLKPHNVLLMSADLMSKDFVCKVGDFGLSRLLINTSHLTTYPSGTVSHMAPELLEAGLLTKSADVFSFGILLWELLSGSGVFAGLTSEQITVSIVEGHRPEMPSFFPEYYSQLIRDCWSPSKECRLTFADLVVKLRTIVNQLLADEASDSPRLQWTSSQFPMNFWSDSLPSEPIVAHPETPKRIPPICKAVGGACNPWLGPGSSQSMVKRVCAAHVRDTSRESCEEVDDKLQGCPMDLNSPNSPTNPVSREICVETESTAGSLSAKRRCCSFGSDCSTLSKHSAVHPVNGSKSLDSPPVRLEEIVTMDSESLLNSVTAADEYKVSFTYNSLDFGLARSADKHHSGRPNVVCGNPNV